MKFKNAMKMVLLTLQFKNTISEKIKSMNFDLCQFRLHKISLYDKTTKDFFSKVRYKKYINSLDF